MIVPATRISKIRGNNTSTGATVSDCKLGIKQNGVTLSKHSALGPSANRMNAQKRIITTLYVSRSPAGSDGPFAESRHALRQDVSTQRVGDIAALAEPAPLLVERCGQRPRRSGIPCCRRRHPRWHVPSRPAIPRPHVPHHPTAQHHSHRGGLSQMNTCAPTKPRPASARVSATNASASRKFATSAWCGGKHHHAQGCVDPGDGITTHYRPAVVGTPYHSKHGGR